MNLDDTEIKLEKAIKAAEAAGLTMTKIPTYEYKEVDIKEEMPTIHDRNLLAELNSESFVQRAFTSSRNKKPNQNIIIDLNAQTVTVPEADVKVQKDDSIIDFNVSNYLKIANISNLLKYGEMECRYIVPESTYIYNKNK